MSAGLVDNLLPRFYFAHPVSEYGTPREAALIRNAKLLLVCQVVNPAEPEHCRGYADCGMAYFLRLCETLDGCFFQPFGDGAIGAGVAAEVKCFLKAGKPVFEVCGSALQRRRRLSPYRILTVERTRERLADIRCGAEL